MTQDSSDPTGFIVSAYPISFTHDDMNQGRFHVLGQFITFRIMIGTFISSAYTSKIYIYKLKLHWSLLLIILLWFLPLVY
jgi:hypothetical protein